MNEQVFIGIFIKYKLSIQEYKKKKVKNLAFTDTECFSAERDESRILFSIFSCSGLELVAGSVVSPIVVDVLLPTS